MNRIILRFILPVLLILCLQNFLPAAENASIEDKLTGTTFKALAKAYLTTVDIEKFKKNNIAKLNLMSDEKFKKRYAVIYNDIKDLPAQLKLSYGITETMTKEHAVKIIKLMDKNKLFSIINAIPDTLIAKQFKQYLNEKKLEIQKSNPAEQINKIWGKITQKTGNSGG